MRTSEILKELRISANLTQKELAQKLNIGQSTIVGYELETREPTAHILLSYANFFDVSVDYLLGREDDFGVRVAAAEPLAANEQELLSCYRQLSPYLQGVALNAVRGWANAAPNGATGTAQKKK